MFRIPFEFDFRAAVGHEAAVACRTEGRAVLPCYRAFVRVERAFYVAVKLVYGLFSLGALRDGEESVEFFEDIVIDRENSLAVVVGRHYRLIRPELESGDIDKEGVHDDCRHEYESHEYRY